MKFKLVNQNDLKRVAHFLIECAITQFIYKATLTMTEFFDNGCEHRKADI